MPEFNYGDLVRVTDCEYCCAMVGDVGRIAEKQQTRDGNFRYLIRFPLSNALFGIRGECIELVERK